MQILEQKALCQQDPDQDEAEEAPEESAEYESVLISSAQDLVAAIANVLGPMFSQVFGTFLPLIGKYYVRWLPSRFGTYTYRLVEKEPLAQRPFRRYRLLG